MFKKDHTFEGQCQVMVTMQCDIDLSNNNTIVCVGHYRQNVPHSEVHRVEKCFPHLFEEEIQSGIKMLYQRCFDSVANIETLFMN